MSNNDKVISAAVHGFWVGCIITLFLTGCLHSKLMRELKTEAINLGYAHMVIVDPHSSYAKFQWIEKKRI